MYELMFLDWRTRKHGTERVEARSFEEARMIGERNADREIIGVRRVF